MVSILPYSPNLALQKSYVAIYKIYVLKNPRTDEIFYVGQTSQELPIRLLGHIHESGESNPEKREYIKTLMDQGFRPLINPIETIMGICYIDKLLVNEREIFWIKYYKSQGVRLLNAAIMHNDAECKDYKTYLRSIKAGQSSYHYYYCGITHGGHQVYDVKKMKADGLRLPEGDPTNVKIVEKIVEKIVYVKRATVQTEYFGSPQPEWTPEFAMSIPPGDFMEEFEMDESDFEPEEESDGSDFEVEHEGENEIGAETLDISTREKQFEEYLQRCREEDPGYIKGQEKL